MGMKTIDRLSVAMALVGSNMRAAWLMATAINAAADDDHIGVYDACRQVVLLACGPKHPMYEAML